MGEVFDGRPRRNSLPVAAEIAEMAARGDDFTSYYTRRCITIKPIRRVSIHCTPGLLRCVDEQAAQFKVSREAAINILIRQALAHQQPKQPQPESPSRTSETA